MPLMFIFCRKLVVFDEWSSLVIHVAMDNTIIEHDISNVLDLIFS